MNLKKISITLFTVTLFLFLIGTFYDWQIDTLLKGHFHTYGKFFETFGLLPITFVRVFCVTYVFRIISLENKRLENCTKVILYYFSTKYVANGLLTINLMLHYWRTGEYTMPGAFIIICYYLIGAILTLIVIRCLYKVNRNTLLPLLNRVIMVFIITFIINFEVEFIKTHVGRARYYTVEAGLGIYTPWYHINGLTDNNDFMSFISGHTTTAFMAILPIFFTLPHQTKLRNYLYAFGVTFGVLVAFSRMVLSQHYLTDVTGSFIISAITIFLMCKLFKVKLDGSEINITKGS